jgi:hypothetical protein
LLLYRIISSTVLKCCWMHVKRHYCRLICFHSCVGAVSELCRSCVGACRSMSEHVGACRSMSEHVGACRSMSESCKNDKLRENGTFNVVILGVPVLFVYRTRRFCTVSDWRADNERYKNYYGNRMTCFAIHPYASNTATKYDMSPTPREQECLLESKN